jgi:uncharacterized protein involved in exopolysaccharide biosynthesis
MKRVLITLTFLGLLLSVIATCRAAPGHRATAQLLVIFRVPSDSAGKKVDGASMGREDRSATQRLLICSPLLVQRAVKKHRLDTLRSLQNHDAVSAILGGLKALRADQGKATDETVLTLGYEGSDGQDCVKILTAVIESYQEFLSETYLDSNEEVARLLHAAQQTLHAQLTEKENAYRKFRQDSPLAKTDAGIAKQRVEDLERASTQARVEAAQWRARLELVEAGLKQPGDHRALLLVAAKPFLQSDRSLAAAAATANSPEVCLECLRQELKVAQGKIALLDNLVAEARRSDQLRATYQVQDETYRNEIARTRQMFDVVLKRLEEINLLKDYGGIMAKVISPPTLAGRN